MTGEAKSNATSNKAARRAHAGAPHHSVEVPPVGQEGRRVHHGEVLRPPHGGHEPLSLCGDGGGHHHQAVDAARLGLRLPLLAPFLSLVVDLNTGGGRGRDDSGGGG